MRKKNHRIYCQRQAGISLLQPSRAREASSNDDRNPSRSKSTLTSSHVQSGYGHGSWAVSKPVAAAAKQSPAPVCQQPAPTSAGPKGPKIPIPLQPVAPRLWDTFHLQRTQRADLLLTRGNEAKLPKFSSDNAQEAGCELCHLAFTQLLVPRQVQPGGD